MRTEGGFWRRESWLGLGLSLVLLLAGGAGLLQGLERRGHDLELSLAGRVPLDRIAVIAIDEASVAELGTWPWSREALARMTDILAGAGARVIGHTQLLAGAERQPGLSQLRALRQQLADLPVDASLAEALQGRFQAAEAALDTDARLAASFRQAGSVVLPFAFQLTPGGAERKLPPYLGSLQLQQIEPGQGQPLTAEAVLLPLDALGEAAQALGYLNLLPDEGGSTPLVIEYQGNYYPSLALMLAARSLGLGVADIRFAPGKSLSLGELRINTDAQARIHPFFYGGREGKPPFAVDAFHEVLSGRIPASRYRDRIVLIGSTVAGQATAMSPDLAPVLILAHTLSSLLQGDYAFSPDWGVWVELGAFLLVALYLILLLPRLANGIAVLVSTLLLLVLLGAHFGLLLGVGIWLHFMGAALLLPGGLLLMLVGRFLAGPQARSQCAAVQPAQEGAVVAPPADAPRLRALAFQGQGLLDQAFEQFRLCPLDPGLMENLYNLALDYERRQQLDKAEAVWRHMARHDPDYRDLMQRLARVRQRAGGLEAKGGASAGARPLPMLGRYQLEKTLGKGAMGVVYQGRDTRINRVVALKTMALSQEFDADALAEVKARFFREAESAGRLNHPHIVTIFDAGEAEGLAYIAMEFLPGGDLVPHVQPDRLLPLERVLEIGARVAEALDYAHRKQVVHRDVKPANIMYDPGSDLVKVTDFGIARITDSSRTRTGMVLGSPSYMSPEQLAGRRIDGRSDLFSLGVTLYQLSCGRLPFVGESMAQLMYRIANEVPPPARGFNGNIPPCLEAVLEKALQKDVSLRYQRGAEMAGELRACLATLVQGSKT
ncbi:CHASE2 domain-containing serine/threonine-protein kinase [Azovibrio restrictus]|uniref:CHASE2 domain-containing serine/threonine-protein kinase n=1 Tax=Azovibrio restrictus TaxID=146938 RepID=UPI0026EF75B8|nr:serine/threonine-protein kinase [Azovibrio restrictus]MDD3481498.1 serine/threonine-protein kinase [Azovibrio restrictus]